MEFSKEVLLTFLNEILSPDEETKQTAEKEIQALEIRATDEFGISLADYVHYNDSVPLQRVATAILKRYIEAHWCSTSEIFQPPEIQLQTKTKIKAELPSGLWSSCIEIRTAVVDSIVVIARFDWPQNWPDLLDKLFRYLHIEDDQSAICGVLQTLIALTKQLTIAQLPLVGTVILEEMYKVFVDETAYSDDIRASVLEVFIEMVTTVTSHKQRGLIERYLEPMITNFCAKFTQNDLKSDAELGCAILKAIEKLTATLPKHVSIFLPKILPDVWETLIHCAKNYQKNTVNIVINQATDSNEDESEDLDDLILPIFRFITVLMAGSSGNKLGLLEYNLLDYHWFHLQDSLPPEVLHHLIFFVEITDQQIQQWTEDPGDFIMQEKLTAESSISQSIRCQAQELLMKIVNRPERAAANALCDVILKQIEAGNAMRANSSSELNQKWWKLHEASIQVFGLIRDTVAVKQQEGTLQFDVIAFLQNVVLVNLDNSGNHPLLVGRCLYIGGLYAEQMPLEMKSRFLEATINGLKCQPICARICAAKAANCWLRAAFVHGNNCERDNILRPLLPALFQELFNLGNQFMIAEVLSIVLENFATLASLDKAFTASVENQISTLAVATFVNFRSNCLVLGICQRIFKELSLNPICAERLQAYLVPTLVGKLNVDPSKELNDDEAQVDALEVLMLLLQYSPRPLSNFLIKSAFPATCRFILSSDKYCTLLKGGKVIRMYLSVAIEQVIEYKNTDEKTGPQYILQIATHLFNIQCGNHLAEDACEIATLLIKNAGSTLGKTVDKLLSVVFSRIKLSETQALKRRLLVVWAHLLNIEFEVVFEFLSTAQGPHEQSAYSFLISDGFCREHEFFNRDDRRTVTLALSKILGYSMTNQDSRLHQINFHDGEGDAESTIPLLVQISNVISNELFLDTRNSL